MWYSLSIGTLFSRSKDFSLARGQQRPDLLLMVNQLDRRSLDFIVAMCGESENMERHTVELVSHGLHGGSARKETKDRPNKLKSMVSFE